MPTTNIFETRAEYSRIRLNELANRLQGLTELQPFDDLTIFAAGSYGRLEATPHSDIDLFFLLHQASKKSPTPRINTLRFFAKLIEIADNMGFPPFSDDGDYLQLLYADDILEHLGGRQDDYLNHFTSRMLLLLESKPITNSDSYEKALKKIIDSYFRDYPDHPQTFRPTFLVNDILRWSQKIGQLLKVYSTG